MYKIRNNLSAKMCLQIYYSFVHSQLNYCFAAKSHIDSVFSKQKSGIRAVMAGFVNFKYRDETIPTHTNYSFNSMKVLTVQNPNAVRERQCLIVHRYTHDNASPYFCTSIFYKGPLLALSTHNEIFYKGPLLAAHTMKI